MGEIYKIRCSCGYSESSIYLGFGMSDWYPSLALCKKCGLTTSADFHNTAELECEKCAEVLLPYTDDKLIKKITTGDKVEHKYYCPKCEKFTLELHETGCWD